MSIRRTLVRSLLLVLLLAGDLRPVVAAAGNGCAPAQSRPVTVLARPGVGHGFAKLEDDGDSAPFVDPAVSRTIVPVRNLVQALAPGEENVTWDEATRTASFSRAGHLLSITIPRGQFQSSTALVNGHEVRVESFICSGRLFAPAHVIAAALGAGIRWYRDRTVVVDPAWEATPDDPDLQRALLSTEYDRLVTSKAEAGPSHAPARSSSVDCDSWPSSLVDFLAAPTQSSRQAARAAACQWVRGW